MMTSCMNWLGGLVGMIAAPSVNFRSLALVRRTTTYTWEEKLQSATGPIGDSKYGAWLTETVTYHH